MSKSNPPTDYETALRQAEQREAEALDAVAEAKARLHLAREALQQVRAQRPLTPYEQAGQLTADEARRVAEAEELLQAADRAHDEATAHRWSLETHQKRGAEYEAALQAHAEAQKTAEVARLRWNEINMAAAAARQARQAAVSRAEVEAARLQLAATTQGGRQAESLRQRLRIGW